MPYSPARMNQYDTLLFFHLLSAFLLVGGALAYHTLGFYLMKRERPSEIATLFGIGRPFALAIQIGAIGVLVFGVWLAYVGEPDYGIFDEWIIAAIVLWVIGNGLGFRGGRIYEEGLKLAERLVEEGNDNPSAELNALLRSRQAAVMTWGSTLSMVAILVLMIWKPGAF
jgi:uncharacterized membrane protein